MKRLLDTNAYSEFKDDKGEVTRLLHAADQVVFSTVVLGELLYGFRHGTRFDHNNRELEAFLANPFVTILPVTRATADRFGRIMASLRKKGRPIPTNDVWIAAHAMESGAELISYDGHFAHVDGLVWRNPAD